MDPLSDVLRAVRLSGAYFYAVEATAPWSVHAAGTRELIPRVLPTAEHVIAYHILTSGRAYASIVGGEATLLEPGDVVVLPHGDAHLLSSDPARFPNAQRMGSAAARYPEVVRLGAGAVPEATFVCGFLGCDLQPFNPLLASLPRLLVARGMRGGWIERFAQEVLAETRRGSAGSELMLSRLAELMFLEVLRHHATSDGAGRTGWFAALGDPVAGAALSRLHATPARAWTLDALAAEIAVSRTRLAERFTRALGVPPMQYLAQWRMQLAAGSLADGGAKIAAVAERVGYESEAAFSRAFKRATGLAPGAWRALRAPRAA